MDNYGPFFSLLISTVFGASVVDFIKKQSQEVKIFAVFLSLLAFVYFSKSFTFSTIIVIALSSVLGYLVSSIKTSRGEDTGSRSRSWNRRSPQDQQEVQELLEDNPGMPHREVASKLDMPRQTVTYLTKRNADGENK